MCFIYKAVDIALRDKGTTPRQRYGGGAAAVFELFAHRTELNSGTTIIR